MQKLKTSKRIDIKDIVYKNFILVHSFLRATSSFFANQAKIPLKHKTIQFDHTTTLRNTLAPYKNQNYTMQHLATQL